VQTLGETSYVAKEEMDQRQDEVRSWRGEGSIGDESSSSSSSSSRSSNGGGGNRMEQNDQVSALIPSLFPPP